MMRYLIIPLLWFNICATLNSSSLPLRDKSFKWESSYLCFTGTSLQKVSILTYNTWGLPVGLPGHQQNLRFPRIPDALKALNASIICLQETFHPALRQEISEKLLDEYPYHTDLNCQREAHGLVRMDCYGGLSTLSKYPILSEQFYPYPLNSKYSLIERTGQKGFLLTTICLGDFVIHVVNTHLYAGYGQLAEDQRAQQLQYLSEILQSRNLLEETVVLAGDLNIQHSSISKSPLYDDLITSRLWKDVQPAINASHFTSDHVTNEYVSDREPRAKLDYILYSPNLSSHMDVLNTGKCLDDKPLLSDHFGWLVTFQVRKRNSEDVGPLASLESYPLENVAIINK